MSERAVLVAPQTQLSLPRPHGAGSPGSWLRYAPGTRRSAAQSPVGGYDAVLEPDRSCRSCGFSPTPRHQVPAWWNPDIQPRRRRAFQPLNDGSGGALLLRDEWRVVAARRQSGCSRVEVLVIRSESIHLAICLSTTLRMPIHPPIHPPGCSASGASAPTSYRHHRRVPPARRSERLRCAWRAARPRGAGYLPCSSLCRRCRAQPTLQTRLRPRAPRRPR